MRTSQKWQCGRATYHTLNIWTATCCSLDKNALCGISPSGNGTYTAEGITALCAGLKGSSITSLR